MEFVQRIKTNFDGALQNIQTLGGIMMTGDSFANKFIVDLYSSDEPVTLSQDTIIRGYFTRSDGENIEVEGGINSEGKAYVVAPDSVYATAGVLTIAIRILEDPIYDESTHQIIDWNKKIVIASMSCDVRPTDTDLHINSQGNPV